MTATNVLQGKMREKGFTLNSLSKAIGISRTALFNKIHNKMDFLVSEVQITSQILGLTDEDVQLIFFAKRVELNSTIPNKP